MTETAPQDGLASPAAALQTRFEAIWHGPMAGLPMLNPALDVQALGFRPWGGHWLGVLLTPWFMNLVLMPRLAAQWQPLAERESRLVVFPAGVFEFLGNQDAELGNYLACSLFSPMFEFADAETAADTARAALEALLDPASRIEAEAPPELGTAPVAAPIAAPATALPTAAAPAAISKRGFLFGTTASRGP
ncbi:hypothetical protein RA210_U80105 [Rubrivivax sp. A210]|uniref:[NiFe]-hydrogenase assembly chaperone HybE n=1 Tax=Rubrivivax sp. A210 TaxID=2772301 RepID=UPI001918207B|nr:[NiFe]-hydrogenase assembly chaperone HybE [Rubrivivax sp. A210]CAD5375023.1 hypothetical protein RA210_U80105 [Rubrivivax sp. A210]